MVIEKTIRIEVAGQDLPGTCEWGEAIAQGKDGWRLPDRDELLLMYEKRDEIGGFASAWYWSSSEGYTHLAWVQNFTYGTQANASKIYPNRVRLVRDVI